MVKPYSLDLRERVAAAVNRDGMARQETALHFGIAASTVINWVKRLSETGSLATGRIGGHRPKKITDADRDWLLQRCQERQFTLRGLMAELAERGLTVGYRAVWNFVHAEKLSYKKTVLAAEQDRPDVARRRMLWKKYQGLVDPPRLVFIDG
jgi:transposase